MGSSTTRLLPMGALGAAAAYFLWPFLDAKGTLPMTTSQSKIPRIEASLLSPASQAPPLRNPFESVQVPEEINPGAVLHPGISNASDIPHEEEAVLPQELVLSSTLVYGRRRHAIINGRIYSEGETLNCASPGPDSAGPNADDPPLRLRRVEHDRVWIDVSRGEKVATLALEYADRKPSRFCASQSNPDSLANEPGSAEEIARLTRSPQLDALRIISQNLFGQDLLGGVVQVPGTMVEQEFAAHSQPGKKTVEPRQLPEIRNAVEPWNSRSSSSPTRPSQTEQRAHP